MSKSLVVPMIAAGLSWLAAPGTARAQGAFEAGLGYEISTGTLSNFENGGVNFALLFGYTYGQRYTVSVRGALTLLNGKTVPDGLGGNAEMPDLNLWRIGMGIDADLLAPRSSSKLLLQGFAGLGILATPVEEVCGVLCWTAPGTTQTNLSVGIGAEYLHAINRQVAIGVGANYYWIFGVEVVGLAGSGSRTVGSLPIAAFLRLSQ